MRKPRRSRRILVAALAVPLLFATACEVVVPVSGTGRAESRPVGSPVLSDSEAAARVRRSSWEPRPENATANRTVPTAAEISWFRALRPEPFMNRVTGNFTGTTDEIIQWAAHKWGIDEDVVRSVATAESWWRMSAVGDNGESHGLMQVRFKYHPGTEPAARSTAFNVDYWGAVQRYYYEGHGTWLNTAGGNGATYAAGDFWGSIGTWYSGRWRDAGALGYIDKIAQDTADKPWEQAGF